MMWHWNYLRDRIERRIKALNPYDIASDYRLGAYQEILRYMKQAEEAYMVQSLIEGGY